MAQAKTKTVAKKSVAKKIPSLKKPAAKKPAAKKPAKNKIKAARIIYLLDRSGSMERLINDAIGSYNTFKGQQQAIKSPTMWNAFQFDNQYESIIENTPVQDVSDLTDKVYYARGTTAYVDALGKTITTFKASNDPKVKTILVVMTDGYENASREFTAEQVKALVAEVQEKLDWEVLFFGANIDALAVGGSLGVAAASTTNFDFNTKGFADAGMTLSVGASMARGVPMATVYTAAVGKQLSEDDIKKMSKGGKADMTQLYQNIKKDTEETGK